LVHGSWLATEGVTVSVGWWLCTLACPPMVAPTIVLPMMVSPSGNVDVPAAKPSAPVSTLHVYGGVPPVAARVHPAYAVFCLPRGQDVVVIVRGAGAAASDIGINRRAMLLLQGPIHVR
jgi:hypothetical protein